MWMVANTAKTMIENQKPWMPESRTASLPAPAPSKATCSAVNWSLE